VRDETRKEGIERERAMRTRFATTLLAAIFAACGCTSLKPGPGFEGVKKDVSERSGLKVHWDTGSGADEDAEAGVRLLLQDELTPEKAMQIAMLNNRELQAVYEELNIAQADLVQAGLLKNPVFSGDMRFGTTGSGTAVDMGIAQDFISILYIPLRKAHAEAAFEAAKIRVTGAVLDLAGETRSVFYDVQASQQLREMRQTVLDATQASYELANRLHDAGNFRDLDLSNERSLYEQAKIDLARSEVVLNTNRERLNELMGLWGTQTGWKSASRLPDISPEDSQDARILERQAVQRSLDLQLAQREIEMAARSLGIARPMALLNELTIGIAAERELHGESKRNNAAILGREITRSLVAGNSAGNALVPQGEPSRGVPPAWSLGPSISLGIPLFDQGQAVVGSAQARLKQSLENYAALAIQIRARLRMVHYATQSARDQALYYQQVILPLRQKIVDESQLQYNAMQLSPFQLLQAKRDQINAGADYIDVLRDYWQSRSQLDQLSNGRMGSAMRSEFVMNVSNNSQGGAISGGRNGH
jgi:cobalt-zinc-cadmium efflux system outer membrane protein